MLEVFRPSYNLLEIWVSSTLFLHSLQQTMLIQASLDAFCGFEGV